MGIGDWGLGIGDWGLGSGDLGLGSMTNFMMPIFEVGTSIDD